MVIVWLGFAGRQQLVIAERGRDFCGCGLVVGCVTGSAGEREGARRGGAGRHGSWLRLMWLRVGRLIVVVLSGRSRRVGRVSRSFLGRFAGKRVKL